MNIKHPEGYWINQLTDEEIKKLIMALISKKEHIKFSGVANIAREKTFIKINYDALRDDCYFKYTSGSCKISDFKITGAMNSLTFYTFMVELFGEEYVNDFYIYAEGIIEQSPESNWSKRLANLKRAMPTILANIKNNNETEITTN